MDLCNEKIKVGKRIDSYIDGCTLQANHGGDHYSHIGGLVAGKQVYTGYHWTLENGVDKTRLTKSGWAILYPKKRKPKSARVDPQLLFEMSR